MSLQETMPRQEAFDADDFVDGWCVSVEDLNKWAKSILERIEQEGLCSDDALAVLVDAVNELAVHTS